MKFSFLLLVTSNAILATSAMYGRYECKHVCRGQGLIDLYEKSVREDPVPHRKIESFEEAIEKLENDVENNYARRLTSHLFDRLGLDRFKCYFKYETYKDRMVEMAKRTEDFQYETDKDRMAKRTDERLAFLVSLQLYKTYHDRVKREAQKNGDHISLGLLQRDKIEIFLPAAAQKKDRFRFEMLLNFGELTEHDFPELMDKAAAQGLDRLVEILLREQRAWDGIASLWQNIKPDTTLPDLVGIHLFEYAKKKIGPSADDQNTANKMFWAAINDGWDIDLLGFLVLLDKADKRSHEVLWHDVLWDPNGIVHDTKRPFIVAVLLAYGKLDGDYYFQKIDFHDPETEAKLKALLGADPLKNLGRGGKGNI